MRTLITLAAGLLALASGAALADGVPLIVPAPALKANDPAFQMIQQSKPRGFVRLHPVIFAAGSFGANVLVVTIDGKDYRFVGSTSPHKVPAVKGVQQPETASSAPPTAPKIMPPQLGFTTWTGKEPGGGTIGITKFDNGNIGATIELPSGRLFVLERPGTSTVLVEIDRAAAYAPPVLVGASGVSK